MNTIIVSNVSSAMICAKWALDLEFSQSRQLVCAIGGLFLGPIMLLILYVRLVRKAKMEGRAGGNIFDSRASMTKRVPLRP